MKTEKQIRDFIAKAESNLNTGLIKPNTDTWKHLVDFIIALKWVLEEAS